MRNLIWVAGLVFFAWLITKGSFVDTTRNKPLPFSELLQRVEQDKVQEVQLDKAVARGKLKPTAPGAAPQEITAELPNDPFTMARLTESMDKHKVTYSYPK